MDYTLWQVRGGVNQDILNRVSALEGGKLDSNRVTQSGVVTEPGFAVDARELNAGMEGTLANLVEGSLNGYRFRLAAIQTDLDSGQTGTLEFNPYDYVPDGSVITGCIDSLPCGWHGVSAAAVRKTTRDGQLFPWVYEIQSGESAGMSPFRIFVLIIYS